MYSRVARHVLLPLHDRVIKRRNTWKYRQFIESSQWWSRDELLAFQWQEASNLLRHAGTQVPYWQGAFQKLGLSADDIRTYDDFRKLPIIEKGDIRAHKQQMIARDHLGKTWTKATG